MDIRFDADLVRRYGGRGPRYTSYPTAVQFSDEFRVGQYRDNAVASNAAALPLSLYVHIPFCHELCYYCGCNKIVTRNQQRVSRYLDCLHREIAMQAELFDRARKVEQLHFGGGTPTYINERQLAVLMDRLDADFGLDLGKGHEYSIEVDPRTVDASRIRELAQLGFNRLSLGIQDFDERVQVAVNRRQSVESIEVLVNAARNHGFRSISFDLIYGLPHQTRDSFSRTLEIVASLRPDRLAVYNYAHLPERFKGQRMIRSEDLPGASDKLAILGETVGYLDKVGYHYVGMDHFALPDDDLVVARHQGTLQRNFQGYSTHRDTDLVGLGVSSIGSIGNVYSQNTTTTMSYEATIESGEIPVHKGIVVDVDDLRRASVIQSIMCYDEFRYGDFEAVHGVDPRQYFASEISRLEPLAIDGLVELHADGIGVTDAGRLLLRSIAMVFDRYLGQDEVRFSKAI